MATHLFHGQRMPERNFLPGGQVKSQVEDMENGLIAALTAGVQLPVTELVTQIFAVFWKTCRMPINRLSCLHWKL